MKNLITLQEAAEITGWSITTLRRNISKGRIPIVRANSDRGKIFIDKELLKETLRREALNSLKNQPFFEEEPEEQPQPLSKLASLFKDTGTQAEQDERFGYQKQVIPLDGTSFYGYNKGGF